MSKLNPHLDPEQVKALGDMNDLHREELKDYSVHIVDTFPNIRDFKQKVSVGTFSWTLHKDKKRLILKGFERDIGAGYQTPSSIAREYLSVRYKQYKRRVTREQKTHIMMHRSAPLFARPAYLSNGVYVDVCETYFQICCAFGWNVDYYPGEYIQTGRPPLDFPTPEDKLARNCLISLGLSSPNYTWTGEKFVSKHSKNPFINYTLWSLTQDILHGLATDALDCGAVYIHTDGYILPSDRVEEFFARCSSWGIRVKIKAQGVSWVWGVGNYRVGRMRSKKLGVFHRTFSNLRFMDYHAWLRRSSYLIVTKRLSEIVYNRALGIL